MADNFYTSKAWFKVRAKVLKRDGHVCVLCHDSVYGKGMARIDHYPHSRKDRPDLALSMENLRTLCSKCDNIQSHARGQRFGYRDVTEVNGDGYPAEWQ
jgi:5-methylcytosine-specific restriction endonuclease McrA